MLVNVVLGGANNVWDWCCFPSQVAQCCAWRTAVFWLCAGHRDVSVMLTARETG